LSFTLSNASLKRALPRRDKPTTKSIVAITKTEERDMKAFLKKLTNP